MSDDVLNPEELLSLLSHHPKYVKLGMVPVLWPAESSKITRESCSSSLGQFDKLPLEILHPILGMLDFRSLCRFQQASLQAKIIVDSFPAYRDFIKYAPYVLTTLGRTETVTFYSSSDLLKTLRTTKCALCEHRGDFLFLMSNQRCCFNCLRNNPLLWVMSPAMAREMFALKTRHVESLPKMVSLTNSRWGDSNAGLMRVDQTPILMQWLVSFKDAFKLGLKYHQSLERMRQKVIGKRLLDNVSTLIYKALEQPNPEVPPPYVGAGLEDNMYKSRDNWRGMGSIPFPSVSPSGTVSNGVWCKGCEREAAAWMDERSWASQGALTLTFDHQRYATLLSGALCSYSEADFLEHIKQCDGSQAFLRVRKQKYSESERIRRNFHRH